MLTTVISKVTQNCKQVGCQAFNRKLSKVTEGAIFRLKEAIGTSHVTTNNSVREHHSRDESMYRGLLPDAVVFPQSTDDVIKVAKICYEEEIPAIPFGSGSGMAGGVVPIQGGIAVDMTQMDQVIKVNQDDFDVTVQPGVTRKFINNHLKDFGLWFPVDPGADASLCGMAATCASGTNAVKYGTMKSNVLNLQVVLSDGTVIMTAGKTTRSRKSSAGYNLTNLFVGSEGTLGFITQATVKVYAVPEMMMAAICQFPSVEGAVQSTVEVLQNGIDIARMEFLDAPSIKYCCEYSKISDLSYKPTLFLEFHGSKKLVEDQVDQTKEIVTSNGGSDFKWASSQEERNKLWTARHNYFYAVTSRHPNKRPHITDIAVPISQLPAAITKTNKLLAEAGLEGPIVGHVGDGNFHVIIMFDEKTEKLCSDVTTAISRLSLEFDGTCSGEHGIGLEKREVLLEQLGKETHDIMTTIKKALDPKGIMNPGKVL